MSARLTLVAFTCSCTMVAYTTLEGTQSLKEQRFACQRTAPPFNFATARSRRIWWLGMQLNSRCKALTQLCAMCGSVDLYFCCFNCTLFSTYLRSLKTQRCACRHCSTWELYDSETTQNLRKFLSTTRYQQGKRRTSLCHNTSTCASLLIFWPFKWIDLAIQRLCLIPPTLGQREGGGSVRDRGLTRTTSISSTASSSIVLSETLCHNHVSINCLTPWCEKCFHDNDSREKWAFSQAGRNRKHMNLWSSFWPFTSPLWFNRALITWFKFTSISRIS